MKQSSNIVLGLDGGGTKTVCVAIPRADTATRSDNKTTIDPNVKPLARVEVGSTNWNSVGLAEAHMNLQLAINNALHATNCTRDNIATICLGISGVDRPEDHARMDGWLQELLPGVPALVHNDAVIALASGTQGHLFGVVLISGTGMVSMGYNHAGERCRAGGWGAVLGDGGSGYAIGAALLSAVTWAHDGRSPQTALTQITLQYLKLDRVEQLVRWTYDDISWHRIAELAPLVLQAAETGDCTALSILRSASTDLALAAESVARRLHLLCSPFPLVLAGGGLRSGLLAQMLADRIYRTMPTAEVIIPTVEPAIGAALLALQYRRDTDNR